MSTTPKYGLGMGFVILACLGMGGPHSLGPKDRSVPFERMVTGKIRGPASAVYCLSADSLFAEGCKGGGLHGCMCPLRAASAFQGSLTLVPDFHSIPGHQPYDVTVQDWIVVLDDETIAVSGSGRYDHWTEPDGAFWQTMTLDLLIRGEGVHFSSGVVEDPAPGGEFPNEVNLTLEDDAECFGFVITMVAQRLPIACDYVLLGDSVFAEGCKGGGPHGCMCPLRAASVFQGRLTLVPDFHAIPGHQPYDVTVQDWIVVLDDETIAVSGSGRYDHWTGLDGTCWQIMTLDLLIRGEEVHFSSGVVEDPAPGGEFPEVLNLTLEDDAECFGFMIAPVAQRLPRVVREMSWFRRAPRDSARRLDF